MKSSGIGGQAVLEGVMMKNRSRYSVAVRTPDGKISTKTGECRSIADKNTFFRLPVIRGVVNFAESLVLGMQTLTYSSSFYEEEEAAKQEKNAEEGDSKETIENIIVVVLAVLLAVGIFMLLPFFLSELLRARIHSQTTLALLEGLLRIILFVGYVIAISFLGDIKRVFMYHGAEHKTINCVENGLELTVENVRKQTKHHRRCGTSFLLIVMFVSIIFFLFIHIENIWLRMLFRILLIPVIAGVSYEFIRLAGSSDHKLVLLLSKPGMLLQRLTTREPDDSMIEVAIASVEAVFDWRGYQRQLLAGDTGTVGADEAEAAAAPQAAAETDEAQVVSREEAAPQADEETSAPETAAGKTDKEKASAPETAAGKTDKGKASAPEAAAGKKKPSEKPKEKGRKTAIVTETKAAASTGEKEGAIAAEEKTKAAPPAVSEKRKAELWNNIKSGLGERVEMVSGKLFRSRAQKKKEMAEREMEYHKRAMERARRMKEQAEREAERERMYQDIEKRRAERLAAGKSGVLAPKVEEDADGDELQSLDHFFDEK